LSRDNILARSRFAVFLRMLVHSTGGGLTKVDFPGNDDAERPGWDGFVEAGGGTPWVPAGRSGWEFGTNEDPKAKAEGDFQKSAKALDKKERAAMTFVFVTPRRWAGKGTWVEAKKAKRLWRNVLPTTRATWHWLEQSLPAQAWFANERHIPAQHVRSLDKCWADWADVSCCATIWVRKLVGVPGFSCAPAPPFCGNFRHSFRRSWRDEPDGQWRQVP